MSSIRTILVPIDFSASSNACLTYAVELAGRLDAKLRLLHAAHVPDAITPGVEWWEGTRKAAVAALEEARRQAEASGRACEVELSDAHPVDAIVDAATKGSVDLIVMGSRGHSPWVRAWLGSVTERTLRSAPCPVLTVPNPEDHADADADTARDT